jgi:hypothetical protein
MRASLTAPAGLKRAFQMVLLELHPIAVSRGDGLDGLENVRTMPFFDNCQEVVMFRS